MMSRISDVAFRRRRRMLRRRQRPAGGAPRRRTDRRAVAGAGQCVSGYETLFHIETLFLTMAANPSRSEHAHARCTCVHSVQ